MQNLKILSVSLVLFCFYSVGVFAQGKNHNVLKCLVCEKIFEEAKKEIDKPQVKKAKIAVGGYHLDDSGNTNQREVPYYESEVFLTEVMEGICDKMKDYVRARRKSDNKLIIMPLILPGGAMNPEFSTVNPIMDGDLNKSLNHYCNEVVNEYEDEIIESFQKSFSEGNGGESDFCSSTSYCLAKEEYDDSDASIPDLGDIFSGPPPREDL